MAGTYSVLHNSWVRGLSPACVLIPPLLCVAHRKHFCMMQGGTLLPNNSATKGSTFSSVAVHIFEDHMATQHPARRDFSSSGRRTYFGTAISHFRQKYREGQRSGEEEEGEEVRHSFCATESAPSSSSGCCCILG